MTTAPSLNEVAEWIVDATPRWHGTSDDPVTILRVLQARDRKLTSTWLSALRATGCSLSPAAITAIESARWRQESYTAISDELTKKFPDLVVSRGPVTAAAYPTGLARYLGDLDVVVPTPERAFEVAAHLVATNWDVGGVTLLHPEGKRHVTVVCTRPAEFADFQPYEVQISTQSVIGDGLITPGLGHVIVRSETLAVLSLFAERLERPYGLRDVLDAWLLLARLASDDREKLARLTSEARLGAQADELTTLVSRWTSAGNLPLSTRGWSPPLGWARPVLQGVLRRPASLRRTPSPRAVVGRVLQHSLVFGNASGRTSAALSLVGASATMTQARRAHWMLWGFSLNPDLAAEATAAFPDRVLTTAAGVWFMTASSTVPDGVAPFAREGSLS